MNRLFTGPGSIRRIIADTVALLAIFAAPYATLFLAHGLSN